MKYSHHSHSSVLKDGLFPQYDDIFIFSFKFIWKKSGMPWKRWIIRELEDIYALINQSQLSQIVGIMLPQNIIHFNHFIILLKLCILNIELGEIMHLQKSPNNEIQDFLQAWYNHREPNDKN